MKLQSRSAATVAGAIGGLVLVAAVGALVLGPGSTEIEVFPEVTLGDPPAPGAPGPSEAVIIEKRTSGGFSLFGLEFRAAKYLVRVQFYAPPECLARLDFEDRWPTSFDECASDVAIEGALAGLGSAPSGDTIVAVDADVPHQCFDAVSAGTSWPPDANACSGV